MFHHGRTKWRRGTDGTTWAENPVCLFNALKFRLSLPTFITFHPDPELLGGEQTPDHQDFHHVALQKNDMMPENNLY